MAERLTERKTTKGITRVVVRSCVCEFQTVLNKLCAFEDIMEKYGIESVEELSKIFSYLSGRFINSVYSLKHKFDSYEDKIKYLANKKGKYYEELYETKQDRDTWKRACELACEEIDSCDNYGCKTYTIPLEEMPQYFYQQAKTEGNDE